MSSLDVRALPVVDREVLIGIVTERDLEPHRGHYEWTAVRTAMTTNPTTVGPATPVSEVARILVEHRFNSIPVVLDGILVGMIGCNDLIRLLTADGVS
jgi:CBS domain-containing protein